MGSTRGAAEGKCRSKKPATRCGAGPSKFQIRKPNTAEIAKASKKSHSQTNAPVKADTCESIQLDPSYSSELETILETYQRWGSLPTSVTLDDLFVATKKLRVLIGKEESSPGITRAVINRGAVPILVKLLYHETDWSTVHEATYALVNVTFEDGTVVYDCPGALSQLINLLVSHSPNIRELAAHCIGNLACESTQYRRAIIGASGAVEGFVRNVQEPANEEVLRTVTWVCRILMAKEPPHSRELARRFVPGFVKLLENCELGQISVSSRVDTVVSLANILEWGSDMQEYCFQCGVLKPLTDLVRNHSASSNRHIMLYTVRAIGQLALLEDDACIDELIRLGFLDHASALLDHQMPAVQAEVCWTLSNIATGSTPQADALLHAGRDHGVVRRLMYIAYNGTHRIRVQAAFAVCHLVTSVHSRHVRLCERLDATAILVQVLRMVEETNLLLAAMDALDRIFHVCGEAAVVNFEELDGEEPLQELHYVVEESVYLKAYHVLTKYFDVEESFDGDDDDLSSVGPEPDDSLSFSLPSKQLFPGDVAAFGSPLTADAGRPFSGFVLSPNLMDMSIGDIAQV